MSLEALKGKGVTKMLKDAGVKTNIFSGGRIDRRDFLGLLGKGAVGAVALILLPEGNKANADTSVDNSLIPDRRAAAGIFGWDQISSDSRFWKSAGDGGWVFDSNGGVDDYGQFVQGDGKNHGIFVGARDGIGGEMRGSMKIVTPNGEFTGLVIAHRNAGLVEAATATVYRHKDPLAGWIKLADEARYNRQPGQIWMPVNDAPGVTNQGEIPLLPISQQDAANMFGIPGTYASIPNNWTVSDGGPQGDRYATLNANGINNGIKIGFDRTPYGTGAVAQGVTSIARNGLGSILFAAHPDVDEVYGAQITVRISTNPNALWRNSLQAQRNSGTGLTVLPIIR